MANDSFNLFVSMFVNFSINCLKENAENLSDLGDLNNLIGLPLGLFNNIHLLASG